MANKPSTPKKTAPQLENFELLVTIPLELDADKVQTQIGQTTGCRFEPTGIGGLGLHGMLIVRAKNQREAGEIGEGVIKRLRLRVGL
jgi:hypothetical protein